MTLRDFLGYKDYPFVEVRTICTDGKGNMDSVYNGWFKFENGDIICSENEDYSLEDEVSGFTEWEGGKGIEFNGVNINATAWKTVING